MVIILKAKDTFSSISSQVLDGFDQHFQASVHLTLTSAVQV